MTCNYTAHEGTRLTAPFRYEWRWNDGPVEGTGKWFFSTAPGGGGSVRLQLKVIGADGAVGEFTKYVYAGQFQPECF